MGKDILCKHWFFLKKATVALLKYEKKNSEQSKLLETDRHYIMIKESVH